MNGLKKLQETLKEAAGFVDKDGIHCVKCRDAFSSANVFTPTGERETHRSGLCERCWDTIFKEEGE